MKRLYQKLFPFTIVILLLGAGIFQAEASYSSLYVFGDGLSTTTNNNSGLSSYYGKRYSNGRVWVEVLAQRQGIAISNNWSYFDCNSANLVTNVKNFAISPALASNALFVVWVNNSDLYDETLNGNTNATEWTAMINRGQTNHFKALTNLYAKGVRTLLMPNAVDVGRVPFFNHYAATNWVRQECIAYNAAFSNTLNQVRAACPGLVIYQPNFFGLLDKVLAHSSDFGLTNALDFYGVPIDAIDALGTAANTNGLGSDYVFWDDTDPTARFHAVIADVTQQFISPVQICRCTIVNNSNQLDVMNVPIGLNGDVEGCTNLVSPNWSSMQNFTSVNTSQSVSIAPSPKTVPQGVVFAPKDGITPPGGGSGTNIVQVVDMHLYRLHFPYAWTWP